MKKWLEKFCKDKGVELSEFDELLKIADDELESAKSTTKDETTKAFNAQIQKLKQNAQTLDEIALMFGGSDNLVEKIKAKFSTNSKSSELELNALKTKLDALSSELENERKAKKEADRKIKLNAIISDIKNLNPDHKEIVEIKLGRALKLDDKGVAYFDTDKGVMDAKSFVESFFRENERYLLPNGSSGLDSKDGYKGGAKKSFKDMSLTEQMILFKQNPSLYEKLKSES